MLSSQLLIGQLVVITSLHTLSWWSAWGSRQKQCQSAERAKRWKCMVTDNSITAMTMTAMVMMMTVVMKIMATKAVKINNNSKRSWISTVNPPLRYHLPKVPEIVYLNYCKTVLYWAVTSIKQSQSPFLRFQSLSYFLLSSPLLNGHSVKMYHTSAPDILCMTFRSIISIVFVQEE